jgi:hypothetical protein
MSPRLTAFELLPIVHARPGAASQTIKPRFSGAFIVLLQFHFNDPAKLAVLTQIGISSPIDINRQILDFSGS